jgi:hypothetical protein
MSFPKVFDPEAMRLRFADLWAAFLREHYRNTEEVAHVFGVRHQTAVNWWAGTNRPTGDKVALVGRRFADWIERDAA